ncbi:MAG: UDP-glucose 4-epimerase GalE [Chloroflexi bacterium]|nr:UDP-glucose 4-epimerase GalE [Chloroflexota bacterium]
MQVLVTGAAGYIGSVVAEQLVEQGHTVIALDNLKAGHRAAVHPAAEFVQVDLLDSAMLKMLVKMRPVDAVVHLAAEALIDVSMRDPGLFFMANVVAGLNLLQAMVEGGIKRIVFSSTAAVYGEPKTLPLTEESDRAPVNPYGESKLAFERILHWFHHAHGMHYVTLRYFNACGATEQHGEYHIPETHIIPILFETALGRRQTFQLYGTDYDTPDGTCIRDYVHVDDIAQAHVLALAKIDSLEARCFNMGNTRGYSNREVIDVARHVTGCTIPFVPTERRPGDPARLVASSERIRRELGWKPRYPDLETMIGTAWQWRMKHPGGYLN